MGKRIRFGEPCGERWADMPARGPGRHCARCAQTVIDFSRLTEREALERLRGGACGRVLVGGDGAPVFRREPQRLGVRALAVVGALAGGCAGGAGQEQPEVAEPAALPPMEAAGPPMRPVGDEPAQTEVPAGVAVNDLSEELVASYDAELAAIRPIVEPTAEQRRLTEAKRRQRLPTVATHPPPQIYMGMMISEDW